MFSLFENKQRINERANEDRKIRIDSEKKCWYTMGGKSFVGSDNEARKIQKWDITVWRQP